MAHFEAEIPWFPNTYDKGGVYFVRFCRETCFFQQKLLKKKAFLGGHRFPVTSRWRVLEAKPDIWSTSGVPLRNFGTLHSSYVGGPWNQKWLHSRALLSFLRADTEKCEKMRSFVKRSVTKKFQQIFLGLLTLELSRIQLPECVYEKKVIHVQSWEIAEKWAC